jgi:hypothetical protein
MKQQKLYWSTGSDLLRDVLTRLMDLPVMDPFRLVGGTGLALQLGHRISNDLDLFTDTEYGGVDLRKIDAILRETFNYVDQGTTDDFQIGIMRIIGNSPVHSVKVDLFYTDTFISPSLMQEGIRLASVEDIAAMKLELISRGGRKKDFWDMIEIIDHYDLARLLEIYREKYPYSDIEEVLTGLTNFSSADEQEDPICLRGRIWELVKLDIEDIVMKYMMK